ncbi:MAG: hypothetical protein AAF447_26650 [Myxococcota bacterium]
MATREDIESYLLRSSLSYKTIGDGESEDGATWLVRETTLPEDETGAIVVSVSAPLCLLRVKVLETASVDRKAELYERLLELNASELVHASYGLSDGSVVLTAGHLLEELDYNEFQGSIDEISLALTNHYETLAGYRAGATA